MNNNQNNIQSTKPKVRIDNFAFGLSFFNGMVRADNLNDYIAKLEVYLKQKYSFLSPDQITLMVQNVKLIMLNDPKPHPLEKQMGLRAGVKYD